jgi:hypothetical protein
VPPVIEEATAGLTVTELTAAPGADGVGVGVEVAVGLIATIAVADFVGSATLVATIVPTPPFEGAVKTPEPLIVPIVLVQVTESFVVAPWIAAVNWALALGDRVATAGDTKIEDTSGVNEEPVPCKGSMAGRCRASVTNTTLPVTLSTLEAENFTLKVALPPPMRFRGIAKPCILKPVPLSTASVTFTGTVPVLVMVTGSELALPTLVVTVRLSGATASVGRGSAMPAQPETQAIASAAKENSTRTSFSCRGFICSRLPFPKLNFFNAIQAFRPPGGVGVPGFRYASE